MKKIKRIKIIINPSAGKHIIKLPFINKLVDPTLLLDLKHLLIEAKQRVPPVLQGYTSSMERFLDLDGVKGCKYCGGPGHRITECPKLLAQKDKAHGNVGQSDFLRDRSGTSGL